VPAKRGIVNDRFSAIGACFELHDEKRRSNEKIQFHDRSLISFSIAIELDHRGTLIFSDSSRSENENPTASVSFRRTIAQNRQKKNMAIPPFYFLV